MPRLLNDDEVTRQLDDLPDWSKVSGAAEITATYELADFAAALAFVNQVGAEAEEMGHHPDIDIRWNTVTLTVATHSEGGLTQLDIELAHRIAQLDRG